MRTPIFSTAVSKFKHQMGSVLLEGLFAILIFSMGILGLVGLQVSSIKQASSAKYRADASMLANELIGQMWISDRTLATLQTNFNTGGASYSTWLTDVQATLPVPSAHPPTVTITSIPSGPTSTPTSRATISIFWQPPGDTSLHSYAVIAQIK